MSDIPGARDGKMMVDEDIWLRLVGEPGKQMQAAHHHFRAGDVGESAMALRAVAVFLRIAEENARDSIAVSLKNSAVELEQLANRVTRDCPFHVKILESAFAHAHHALASHYAARAGLALDQKRLTRAANYLGSAVNHVERSASWCNQHLKPETNGVMNRSREIVSILRRGGPDAVEAANDIIFRLHARLADVGLFLPAVPAA